MTELMTLGESVHTDRGRPWLNGNEAACGAARPVLRDGRPVDISAFVDAVRRFGSTPTENGTRAASDAVLAPRVHATLRLTRREAGDPGLWAWLAACAVPEYVRWRWASRAAGTDDPVPPARWYGPVNKQAIARLWWGMELFRNGPEYPTHLFEIQDVPNSILHRRFVRYRPIAVALDGAIANRVMAEGKEGERQLRRWFSAINLYGGSRDLAALTRFHRDDIAAIRRWVGEAPHASEITGPPDRPVSDESLAHARAFLADVWRGAVRGAP